MAPSTLGGEPPFWHSIQNFFGISPLSYAVFWGHITTAQALIDGGANPRLEANAVALYNAVLRGNTDMAALLLSHGADPNAVTGPNPGMTPLHVLAERTVGTGLPWTDKYMTDLLLSWGADPLVRDRKGRNSFLAAIEAVNPNFVAHLWGRVGGLVGATKTSDGLSCTELVAHLGDPEILEVFKNIELPEHDRYTCKRCRIENPF